MSAAISALPTGEIQLTGSRSKLSSSTPTMVNVSVAPFLSLCVTLAPNVTLFDGAFGGSTTWPDARICSNSMMRSLLAFAARKLVQSVAQTLRAARGNVIASSRRQS